MQGRESPGGHLRSSHSAGRYRNKQSRGPSNEEPANPMPRPTRAQSPRTPPSSCHVSKEALQCVARETEELDLLVSPGRDRPHLPAKADQASDGILRELR